MPTHHGLSFSQSVDLAAEYDIATDASAAIDDALADALADDTLVELPPGEYLVEQPHKLTGVSRVGIRGDGTRPEDVTFVFPDGNAGAPKPANFVLFWLEAGQILVENFEIHQTADRETAASIVAWADSKLTVRDLTWEGFNPISSHAKGTCLYPSVRSDSGTGTVSGVTIRGGGVLDTYPNRRMGILCQQNHAGTLTISDCDIRELGSTAIRATRCPGTVQIESSYFENNDNGSLRFGGGRAGESVARNCTVVVDRDRLQHLPDGEAYEGLDGARIDANGQGWTGATIEDCDFLFRSLPSADSFARGVIARPSWGDHGRFTVENTTIQLDCDGPPAVFADAPGDGAGGETGVTLDNVHITGRQTRTREAGVVSIVRSSGTRVRDCCISVPDTSADGVHVSDSADAQVESSGISVGGQAVTGATATDITRAEGCRTPSGIRPEDGPRLPHELVIRGTGQKANYSFAVSGELVGAQLESWDNQTGAEAEGWVTTREDVDVYRFSESVTRFELLTGDSVDLALDGVSVTLAGLTGEAVDDGGDETTPPDASDGESAPQRTVTISNDDAGSVEYRFDVQGTVVDAPASATVLSRRDDGVTPVAATTRSGWTQRFTIRGSLLGSDLPDGLTLSVSDATDD